MTEDHDLLRRFAVSGDEPAFAELVARKVNLVYSAALRLVHGNPHLAREVAQAVFLDLARKAASLSRHPSLAGWLHTSTRYAAAKIRRDRGRWLQRHEEISTMPDTPAPEPAWDQLGPMLDEALGELPRSDREVLLLRFFESRPFAEIGGRIGLSENSARMRSERALEKLRLILARRGVRSTSAALGLVLTQQAVSAAPAGLAATLANAAVAGAAQAPAGLSLFLLMAKSKLQIAAFGLLGLATLSALLLQSRTAAKLAVRDQELQKSSATLAALRSENRRLAANAADSPAPGAEAAPTAGPRPATAAGPVSVSAAFTPANGVRFVTKLGDDPEMQRLTGLQQRASVERRYAALFEALGLTAEQREQAATLLVERANAASGAVEGAMLRGPLTPDRAGDLAAELTALVGDRAAEVDSRLRQLLGEDAFARYQDYQATLPQRSLAEQLASRLASTGSPLTGTQIDQLVHGLAAATPADAGAPASAPAVLGDRVAVFQTAATSEGSPGGKRMSISVSAGALEGSNLPISDAMMAQAQSVLDATQLAALRQMQHEQQTAQALQQHLISNLATPAAPASE
jgi:RNA polymerase sigma factor (sigma-70 family)